MRLHGAVALAVGLLAHQAHSTPLNSLMEQCAPNVHPITMTALIRTESGGQAFAISDDGVAGQPWSARKNQIRSYTPNNAAAAAKLATSLIERGHLVGLGLTQVNSKNLRRFGLTVRQALDPCINLRTGAAILAEFYVDALATYRSPAPALFAALSAYNTGSFVNGIKNGYVARIIRASSIHVPALPVLNQPQSRHIQADFRVRHPPMLLSRKFTVLTATVAQ